MCLAVVAMVIPALMFGALKKTPLYVCGFASTFNDSTVYFSDIQQLDNTWTDSKTGFLYSRDNYSYQLREYLQKQGVAHPTCIVMFASTRKKLEKEYVALKKRYTTRGQYNVKYVAGNEFAFAPIEPDETEINAALKKDKEQKLAKKQAKLDKKKEKKAKKEELKALEQQVKERKK